MLANFSIENSQLLVRWDDLSLDDPRRDRRGLDPPYGRGPSPEGAASASNRPR